MKKILMILGGLTIAGACGTCLVCGGLVGGAAFVADEVAQSSSTTRTSSRRPEQPAPSINETVRLSDSDWTVLGAQKLGQHLRSNNQFHEHARTEGYYIQVDFRVLNTGDREERILSHPVVVDDRGREFKDLDGQSFYLPSNTKTMTLEALPSGLAREFSAIYELPPDAKGLHFQARRLRFGRETRLIQLDLDDLSEE